MIEPKWPAGEWTACRKGECSCKQIWAQDHPIAQVTAGKWGDTYPSVRLVGETSLELKAEAYTAMIEYGEVSEESALAVVRLILAAPKLYAALVRMIDGRVRESHNAVHPSRQFCQTCGCNSESSVHFDGCPVLQAEIAIAEALGETDA